MTLLPLDDERTLSISQFCEAEGLTEHEYELLRDIGKAPVEIALIAGREFGCRITPQSRRDWHAMICVIEEAEKRFDNPPLGEILTRYHHLRHGRVVLTRDERGLPSGVREVGPETKLSTEGTA